jgi:hypothetical protein
VTEVLDSSRCRIIATQHLRVTRAGSLLSAATSLTRGVFALSNLFHPARLRWSGSAFGNVG